MEMYEKVILGILTVILYGVMIGFWIGAYVYSIQIDLLWLLGTMTPAGFVTFCWYMESQRDGEE